MSGAIASNGFDAATAAAIASAEVEIGAAKIGCAFCRRYRHEVLCLVVQGLAAICSECLGEALAVLRADVARSLAEERTARYPMVPHGTKPAAPEKPNGHAPPLTGRDGYTGEMCPSCFNFRMIRNGTCSLCLDCYSTAGGCS
jgi:hypothetical protein